MRSGRLLWAVFALGCHGVGTDTHEQGSDASVARAPVVDAAKPESLVLLPSTRVDVTLPTHADGVTEIASAGLRAKVQLVGAAHVEAAAQGDRVRFARAYAGADVEHVRTAIGEEDFVHFAKKPKDTVVRWSFAPSGVAGLRLVANTLELLDAEGMPRLRVPSPYVVDARGTRRAATLEVEGCAVDRDLRPAWGRALTAPAASCELVVRWSDQGLAYPLTLDPAWTTTASLATARKAHTAVAVQATGACSAGCVLVVGGLNNFRVSAPDPEIYSVASGTWTTAPFPFSIPILSTETQSDIAGADATGGTALFYGGIGTTSAGARWDAATATWTNLDAPTTSRRAQGSMATLPGVGAILLGGWTYGTGTADRSAYVWTKSTGAWSLSNSLALSLQRSYPLIAVYRSPTSQTTVCAFGSGFSADCGAIETATWKNYSSVFFNPNAIATVGALAYLTDKTGALRYANLGSISTDLRTGACTGCTFNGPITGVVGTALDARQGALVSTDRFMFIGGSGTDPSTGAIVGSAVVDSYLPGADPTNATATTMVRSTGSLNVARMQHTATSLPNGRVLVVAGTSADSPAVAPLTSVELFGLIAKGGACTSSFECDAGLSCAEGVCCDLGGASKTGCSDKCESCLVAGKVGTCSPRPARSLPEVGHGSCPAPAGGSCGYTCDGANRTSCAVAGTSASCASATCVDNSSGPSTFTAISTCDGAGACTYATPGTCGKYKCASATACRTTCTVNTDCADGNKCSGGVCVDAGNRGAACTVTSDCLPGLSLTCVDGVCCTASSCPSGFSCSAGGGFCKKPLGGTCTGGTATDCASGFCAPEGVCCNTACNGQCEECKAIGTVGTCTPRPALSDPTGGRTACGGSGDCRATCDGTTRTACGPYPSKLKSCGAAACSTTTNLANEASFCDGSGACVAGATTSCTPYKCSGTACGKTCTATSDCQSGYFCDTAKSLCVTTGDLGSSCGSASQCKSGNCVDGVCCSTATCSSGLTCAANGKGTCSKPIGAACSAATECGSGFCADGVCCNAACTGSCESCSLTGLAGTCTPVPSGGDAAHGSCPGTGSCRSKCDGTTRAACGPLPGVSTACAPTSCAAGKLTGTSYCDGLGGCATPAPSTCTPYVCGSTSACGLSCTTTADCATGYACKAGRCETTGDLGTFCDDPSQCKSGKCIAAVTAGKTVCCSADTCPTGTYCGEAGTPGAGTCVKRGGSSCTDPNDCASGFCVDGVCCESACGGQCQACDVPSSLGKCVAVSGAPHGTRAKCSDGGTDVCKAQSCDGVDGTKCASFTGAGVECSRACADEATVAVGSCDGVGACGAAKNSSCSGFKCASGKCLTTCTKNAECSTGYYCNSGTSRCEPALGKCSDDRSKSTSADGAVVTDCFPFLCDAGSGGCVKTCTSTANDCAPGQVCGEGACKPAPGDTDESGGCAVESPGGRSGAGLGFAALLVLSVLSRRRRA